MERIRRQFVTDKTFLSVRPANELGLHAYALWKFTYQILQDWQIIVTCIRMCSTL